jgi:hypothetical protein
VFACKNCRHFKFFNKLLSNIFITPFNYNGAWGIVVVKALRYKLEGLGIDSRCRRDFSVASDSSMCPGVDSASKNEYQVNPGGNGSRCVRLTTYHLHVLMSRNLGALTSRNPLALFRPVMGQLYLVIIIMQISFPLKFLLVGGCVANYWSF